MSCRRGGPIWAHSNRCSETSARIRWNLSHIWSLPSRIWPMAVDLIDQIWEAGFCAALVEIGLHLAVSGLNLVDSGRSLSNISRDRANLFARCRPNFAPVVQNRPKLGRTRSDFGATRTKLGSILASFARHSAACGRFRPNGSTPESARFGPMRNMFGRTLNDLLCVPGGALHREGQDSRRMGPQNGPSRTAQS